jgi:hypothetical protein
MTFLRPFAIAAAAGAACLAPAAPAPAQGADTPPEVEGTVPDGLLDSFIDAALDVSGTAQRYEGRMADVADDAARQRLAAQARVEMLAAVEASKGITVEEYLDISEAARADAELGRRLQERLAARAD